MNRFVIIIEEEYDQYTVNVPYPMTTELSKEELNALLLEHSKKVFESRNKRNASRDSLDIKISNIYICKNNFLDNGVIENGQIIYSLRAPPVLTVDEWFNE